MIKPNLIARLPATLLFAAAVPIVHADIINFGTWYEFSFLDAGTPAMGCDPADPGGLICIPSSGTPTVFAPAPAWTLTTSAGSQTLLTVTDAFYHGDAFDVYDFGIYIGSTSPPVPLDFVSCGDDPVPCLADPLISSGEFLLGAGDHAISITPNTSPLGGGSAYFEMRPVPEPAALLLLVGVLPVLRRHLSHRYSYK